MCGIVGVFSVRGAYQCSARELASMRDTMTARGPDDAGLFIHDHEGVFAGLAHRRLSIIDLSPLGRQPMQTSDGRLTIVFNGEIFNYLELRRELLDRGKYHFRSKTDTEVILYGLEEWGIDGCLKRLRGMYAFAVFDDRDKSVTLVRDPLGVKPLYFTLNDRRLIFASEIKAILAAPEFHKELNATGLYHYLTFANVPAPHSLFKGIEKLGPGTFLNVGCDWSVRRVHYWDPGRFLPQAGEIDEEDCVRQVTRLLQTAVERRMISDVPFGVFLSGGVDSSLNVALMAAQMDRPVETFSIGIRGDSSNEFEHARKVANHFGTNHHKILIGDEEFISFLPQMAYFQDEPLADPVCVPIYYVSKLARDCGTIVVQVGEGSDEVFAGYDLYHSFARWGREFFDPYLRMPRWVRESTWRIARAAAAPQLADAFRRAAEDEPLFVGNAIAFWDIEKRRLLQNPVEGESSGRLIGELVTARNGMSALDRIIQVELRNRLPELLLMRVDKMTMATSVEARVPFLDEDVVEFALAIPSSLKRKKGVNKYILKKVAERFLPKDIIYRNKWGFCGSATNILTPGLASYARKTILQSPLMAEIFDREEVERLFELHKRQRRFYSFKIWNLLNLVLWHNEWFINGAGGSHKPLQSDETDNN